MKLAFFILAHKNLPQVARLIDRLDSPDSVFIIHGDQRAAPDFQQALQRMADGRVNLFLAAPQRCYWGGIGIVKATLACIDRAFESRAMFDYGILLSGQDYPLRSRQEIGEFFDQHADTQFIESFPMHGSNRWSHMPGPYQAVNRVAWLTLFIRSRRIHLPIRRQMPAGFEPYGGSQWWALTRACLVHIRSVQHSRPDLLRFYAHAYIPDESYFQTVISNSAFAAAIHSDDLHYIDWARPNPHAPRTLEISDQRLLMDSGKLFARKFDVTRDADVIDWLDRRIDASACAQPAAGNSLPVDYAVGSAAASS